MDQAIPASSTNRPLAGIAWMIVCGICFVSVQSIVKALGSHIPAAEAAFLRYVLGLVFLLPMIRPMLKTRLTRKDNGLYALRGAIHTVAVITWFYAMSRITLAEVTALNYLAPVYVTIGAALFLGERFAILRMLAVLAALCGVLMIIRPGFREIELGHYSMLLSGLCFGGSYLIAKPLALRHPPQVVVGFLSVWVTLGLFPFAIADWVTPSLYDCLALFLVAAFATAGHYTMTLAFRCAPVSITQPVQFLQLVWSVAVGALFFLEPVDTYVVLGGALIVAAISFIAWRETRQKTKV